MHIGEQLRWWGIGLALFAALLWLLADALAPFLLGAAIAYLTDPLADRLERMGLSRMMATVTITVGSVGLGVLLLLLVVPALIQQIRSVVENSPLYIDQARMLISAWVPDISAGDSFIRSAFESLKGRVEGWSVSVIEKVWTGGLAIIDFVTLLFITPVVAFYLLFDWDNLIAKLDDLSPREHRGVIRRLASELDDVLAGFIRGQLTVCLILGSFYAVSLSLIGLPFGLLVGAFAGLISFIPFVGSILGGAISIGIAIAHFWGDWQWIAATAAVFGIGQAIEGNFLTPKLVGDHVKLHPVWLMFALSAFGALMGFVGLLIAVPAAAGIGVLARFLVEQYKSGGLYRGSAEWQESENRSVSLARSGAEADAAEGESRDETP